MIRSGAATRRTRVDYGSTLSVTADCCQRAGRRREKVGPLERGVYALSLKVFGRHRGRADSLDSRGLCDREGLVATSDQRS
jgi:hypothetical protein